MAAAKRRRNMVGATLGLAENGISGLPEDIIHHILSYLETTEEALRTSICCKTWYSAWLTSPSLSFRDLSWKEKRVKFIERTVERYEEQKIRIEHFNLRLHIYCLEQQVNKWIGVAVQNGVQSLQLDIDAPFNMKNEYTLPDCIFEAKSLRELIIKRGIIDDDKVILFNHLRKLHLSFITIHDDMFQAIIAGCPLIHNLKVAYCESLKLVKVTGLNNLKEFTVFATKNQDVEIEAPNLEYLDCRMDGGSLKFLCKTEKLKYLKLIGHMDLSSTLFSVDGRIDISSHSLEHITLGLLFNAHGGIDISSHSLKHIVLNLCKESREVNIDAPNMVSLELDNTKFFPDVSITNAPTHLVFKTVISPGDSLDDDYFCKMKQVLAKISPSKISLVMCWSTHDINLFDINLQRIPICPMVHVEDLHLDFVRKTPSPHSNFLDALFLICHPKAIIIDPHFRNVNAVPFLYNNLIERDENKSLYQDLKEVKFEIYDKTKHEWNPSDWKSLPEEPKNWPIFRFRLEWKSTS